MHISTSAALLAPAWQLERDVRRPETAKLRGGLVAILLVTSLLACSKAQLGLPRIALSSTSPDGRFVAEVHNHPDIDPPNQSLWVGNADGPLQEVAHLFPDMDNCRNIAWSADSSTVAFVIRGARLRVVHAATNETVFNKWVVELHGEYPPALQVQGLTLSADGTRATFRACRRSGECSHFKTIDITGEAHGGPA